MLHEIHTWTQGPGQNLTDVLFSPHAADHHCSIKYCGKKVARKTESFFPGILSFEFLHIAQTKQSKHCTTVCVCMCTGLLSWLTDIMGTNVTLPDSITSGQLLFILSLNNISKLIIIFDPDLIISLF